MRLISNKELVLVSGGNDVIKDGNDDCVRSNIGISQTDDQFNPIVIAVIGVVGIIAAAVIGYFAKEEENKNEIAKQIEQTITTTLKCEPSPTGDGSEICAVTGKVITDYKYRK